MKITSLDIQQQQFNVRFRGFDIREVDSFLEQITNEFETLQQNIENLHTENRRLKLEVQGHKERDDSFKRALINAQKMLDKMKENARKEAELIIAEAEVKAEKILSRVHNRVAQLHEDINELKRQRTQIEVQLRGVLEAHMKLLDMGQEDAKVLDEAEDKIRIIGNRK